MRNLVGALFLTGIVSSLTIGSSSVVSAQSLSDFAAATAGSTVGGAAGKPVSNALTNVFTSVDKQARTVASSNSPSLKGGPGQAKQDLEKASSGSSAADRTAAERAKLYESAPFLAELYDLPAMPETAVPTGNLAGAIANPAPQPPPEMSSESFKNVSNGMGRAELLKFGAPASKVTMDEDGHVIEIFSYRQSGSSIGIVRLSDGAVAAIQPR